MIAEGDKAVELLKRAAVNLGEHFDSVQIFATRHDAGPDDETITVKFGVGNYYARFGQVREWLVKEEEVARIGIRKDSEP